MSGKALRFQNHDSQNVPAARHDGSRPGALASWATLNPQVSAIRESPRLATQRRLLDSMTGSKDAVAGVAAGARGAVGKSVLQAAFAGPKFKKSNPNNSGYTIHTFNTGTTNSLTGCGTDNEIITAGEKLNSNTSDAGTPKRMSAYSKGYSMTGGLVRDKSLDQASTKMHLINHRLDDSKNTQKQRANIFLGTQKTNNPTHLHEVENHVINAAGFGTGENVAYQATMKKAKWVPDLDNSRKMVAYWPDADKPADTEVTNSALDSVYESVAGTPASGIQNSPPGKLAKTTMMKKPKQDGWALRSTTGLDKHLWLKYRVKVNYGTVPSHIDANVKKEISANTIKKGLYKNIGKPVSVKLDAKIKKFSAGWDVDALPSDFANTVSYFYASYDPNNIYYREDESHKIDAAL